MKIKMIKDKETKGAIRYSDGDGHNIYLKKDEAAKLGTPDSVEVTIE